MKSRLWLLAMWFAFIPAWAQQADEAQANKPPANAITGRVLGEDGQPLGGVFVHLFKVGGNSSTAGAMTDEEGKFTFPNLSPGRYNVSTSLANYVFATRSKADHLLVGDHVTITLVKGGVITGRVLNTQNEPVVGAMVGAQRVRNADGQAISSSGASIRSAMTDDRGVYRIFGLPPGAYFIEVKNNAGLFANVPTDAPTYFPSSTRDSAQEITVGVGAEVAGIDITYRGERGYTVSGTVSGLIDPSVEAIISINLTSTTGSSVMSGGLNRGAMGNRFAIYDVPDGDYEIRASRVDWNTGGSAASGFATPLKIKVRGGDVTGLELKLLPTATISGRVVLEKLTRDKSLCPLSRAVQVEEMQIYATAFDPAQRSQLNPRPVVPEASGDFVLRGLSAGRFRFFTQLPSDFLYVRAISLKSQSANLPSSRANALASQTTDVSPHGVSLAAGEKLTGVTINVAEGAVAVSGNVVAEPGTTLPARLSVHLFPLEAASDSLRYAVTPVQSDATFSFRHLAPGKYLLLARPQSAASLESENRAQLRREAEAANNVIEVAPCQQVKNLGLKFGGVVK